MKKKLISLLTCCLLFVFSIFTLCSCAPVKTDTEKKNGSVAVQIGNISLTKADVINQFYSYYQERSYVLSYGMQDEETFINNFYSWLEKRQIIKEKSAAALYNETTNPNGYIYYTEEDEADVWHSVYEYFYSEVTDYEKSIFSVSKFEEDEYPVWLKSEEEEDSKTTFKPYESAKPVVDTEKRKNESVTKMTEAEVKSAATIKKVKDYLFEYVVGQDSDKDIREKISYEKFENDERYIELNFVQRGSNPRNEAYAKMIEWLVSSAKSSGKNTDANVVLENEILRVYNAYYDAKITSIYQDYLLKEYLTGIGENTDKTTLSEEAIASAFINNYLTDLQKFSNENSYITTITSSDNKSIILYNYNGKNFFFTVQHILIQFDDFISEEIKNLKGYTDSSSSNLDAAVADQFKADREELVKKYKGMLATVNEDNYKELSSLQAEIDKNVKYYYYDEASNDKTGAGYIEVTKDSTTGKYVNSSKNIEVEAEEVKKMASKEDIIKIYNGLLKDFTTKFLNYYDGVTDENFNKEKNKDLEYIFNMVDDIKVNYGTDTDAAKTLIKNKLSSMVFIELEFIFSTDALGNEYKNKLGYVMSNYPTETSGMVPEFADGSKDIFKEIVKQSNGGTLAEDYVVDASDIQTIKTGINSAIDSFLNSNGTSEPAFINTIISRYGYHMIKVEDIFVPGESMITISDFTNTSEIIKALKKTYVCGGSNQTLYNYFYDMLYNGNVGSSNSSRNYYSKLQDKWVEEYKNSNKITYTNKMNYDDLIAEIS